MENLKVRVNNEAESREAIDFFKSLGYEKAFHEPEFGFYQFLFAKRDGFITWHDDFGFFKKHNARLITTQQLRDLVVLKRNDVNDATHENAMYPYIKLSDGWYYFDDDVEKWLKSIGRKPEYYEKLKPIEKEVKEYLEKQADGSYELVLAYRKEGNDWIEVPLSGVNCYNYLYKNGINLAWTENPASHYGELLWQRSETEKVQGCGDNVNNPSHYSDSSIECIDAMEAMLTPEQFVGYLRGNMFKYQWRYQKKNGVEDLKKSQWYLNKLIEVEIARS